MSEGKEITIQAPKPVTWAWTIVGDALYLQHQGGDTIRVNKVAGEWVLEAVPERIIGESKK